MNPKPRIHPVSRQQCDDSAVSRSLAYGSHDGFETIRDQEPPRRHPGGDESLFIVAPDRREAEVRSQSAKPTFRLSRGPDLRYLPYSQLQANREPLGRFGVGVEALKRISHLL
jgi:hypothetical protein